MDFRYMGYLKPGNKFYENSNNLSKQYQINSNILKNYEIITDNEHWTMCMYKNDKLPTQGWKIHISSKYEDAQSILNEVSNFLWKKEISFKYVKREDLLFLKNSKYGDRSSSGKFITIYPHNEKEFIDLLHSLDCIVKRFENGPYILSDKRWKDGNVFFRYGGFEKIIKKLKGKELYCIRNTKGELIEDVRKPYYILPDFVKEPKEVVEMEKSINQKDEGENKFDKFKITNALHFSNGGGVYEALQKSTGLKVVIKEARPEAGLDANYRDAVYRLKKEDYVLRKLKFSKYTPDHIDFFKAWENYFLVEEFVEGGQLTTWISKNYPFSYDSSNTYKYLDSAKKIIKNIINGLSEIHKQGIGFGDLQPSNILISKELDVKFIDFETSSNLLENLKPSLMTPGFVDGRTTNVKESDWFGAIQLIKYIFLPIGPVDLLDDTLRNNHYEYIGKLYGEDIKKFVLDMTNKCLESCKFESKELITVLKYDSQMKSNNKFSDEKVLGIVSKLANGIKYDISNSKGIFSHGDIRVYIHKMGKYNILTGAYGVINSLYSANKIDKTCIEWVKSNCDFSEYDEWGLFTGRTGVASVLFKLGFIEEFEQTVDELKSYIYNKLDTFDDISILSGLSGMGLFLLSYYHKAPLECRKEIMDVLNNIVSKIKNLFELDIELTSYDLDFVPMGFFEGWSGVAYFVIQLYKVTKDKELEKLANRMIKVELKNCMENPLDKSLNISDGKRLLPYILGGSAGIIYTLDEYKNIFDEEFEVYKNKILKVINSRCFYGIGLFRGAIGLATLLPYIDDLNIRNKYRDICLEKLNLFLVDEDDMLFTPGDFSYRLSSDLFSGSAGIIAVLLDLINNKKISWLPIL